MNRYLRDRANRRSMAQRDGRNPYGSRGGYVTSSRRGKDRAYMNYDNYRGGDNRMRDRNYNYDYGYDYASEDMEKEWEEDLKKWREELKRYDRFNISKEQIIQSAKQMGAEFDKYNEEEFLTTYYMVMSDYPQITNEPHIYISLAKDWLEDKDSKLKGSEKLCAYYYEVINGGEED